ncbi:helix-turn-helix domain-containing protein [Listeria monocytogenes]|uniref:helix-turn-helix domain-containing protein n=1 Tax=Listeria monocytogenes TaxID=1639 RepID=UPI0011EB1A29|nr:XRE family transcriptional regulator [Listeria monocytogenes]TYU88959.1 helix-turn-helix domain-containing protein [Listeria monocytogenes]
MLGENLKELRKSHKLTLQALADSLNSTYPNTFNFNKGRISKWENNVDEPSLATARILADFFNISIDNLYYGIEKKNKDILSQITKTTEKLKEEKQQIVLNAAKKELFDQEQEQQKKLTSLEVHREKRRKKQVLGKLDWLGSISAGTGEFLSDNQLEEIELPIEMIPDDADFCLSVNGNSMEPIFHDDAYVFISKQCTLYSGAIGAVIVNGEAFLKRIWFENNHARLESFNKKYKDIIVTEDDDFKIIGKVVM